MEIDNEDYCEIVFDSNIDRVANLKILETFEAFEKTSKPKKQFVSKTIKAEGQKFKNYCFTGFTHSEFMSKSTKVSTGIDIEWILEFLRTQIRKLQQENEQRCNSKSAEQNTTVARNN